MEKYLNNSQQLLIDIIELIGKDPFKWWTLKELASELNTSEDKIFRTLQNLHHRGWVEKDQREYRIAPDFTKFSEGVRKKISETIKRYLGEV